MGVNASHTGETSGGFAVRPPRPGDAAELGALHNLVWRHAYAGLMPQAYLDARDDDAAEERWSETIAGLDDEGRGVPGRGVVGRRTLVAVTAPGDPAEGSVIGFVTVGPARRVEHVGMVELMALYVHPSWHGHGVAQALTREAFADPTFTDHPVMLWVLEGNDRAMRFYTKLGFEARDDVLVHEPTGARERLMVRPGRRHA